MNANREQVFANLAKGKTADQLRYLQSRFDADGIDVDIGEYAETSASLEWDEFKKGALEGLTFGAYTPEDRHPAAADFKVPFTDMEIGVGNITGNLVGGVPSAVAGLGVGGVAARSIAPARKFLKAAGPTLKAAKSAKRGQRAIQLGVGEFVPGTAAGVYRSGGDPEAALQMGATFLVGGLILEGTFAAFSRAMKKMKAGKKLDDVDETAVHEFESVAQREGAESPLMNIPTGISILDDRPYMPSSRLAKLERSGPDAPDAVDQSELETLRKARESLVKPDDEVAELEALRSSREGELADVDDPVELAGLQADREAQLAEIDDAIENAKLRVERKAHLSAPHQFVEGYTNRFSDEILGDMEGGPSVIADETQRRASIADLLNEELGKYSEISNVYGRRLQEQVTDLSYSAADGVKYGVLTPDDARTLIGRAFEVDVQTLSKDITALDKKINAARGTNTNTAEAVKAEIHTQAVSKNKRSMKLPSAAKLSSIREGEPFFGIYHPRVGDPFGFTSLGRSQYDNVSGETTFRYLNDDGVESTLFVRSGDKIRQLGVAGASGDEVERVAKSSVSKQVLERLGIARSRLDRLVNSRGSKSKTEVDNYSSSMTMAEGLEQLSVYRQQSRQFEKAQQAAFNDSWFKVKDRTGEGTWSDSPSAWRKYSFPWFVRKITPVTSRLNLGGDPETARVVAEGVWHKEMMGADFGKWMQEYETIMKQFQVGYLEQLRARANDSTARIAVEQVQGARAKLARALDGEVQLLENAPELVPTFLELRNLLDDMGKYANIDIEPGAALKDYFPHIFDGTVGKWRAKRFFEETGRSNKNLSDIAADMSDENIPGKPEFFADKERFGVDGYGFDLDKAMYTYIRGMTEKKHRGAFWQAASGRLEALRNLPGKQQLHSEFKDFIDYALGAPTNSRKRVAAFFRDSEQFQQGMNWLTSAIGGAPERDLLFRAKVLRANGAELSNADIQQATSFIDKLVQDANKFTKEGKFSDVAATKRWRAELALKVDDIRQGMSDPNLAPPIISSLYELIVVNKLALSASHGIMNTTQTITNVVPHLGALAVGKGIKRLFGPEDAMIADSGMTVRDIIELSGVDQDMPEALEFFGGVRGTMKKVRDDLLMAPATLSEKFNRRVALLASYEHEIVKGATHDAALIKSIELVQKAHFPFNRFGTVPAMRNPGIRLLTMFQSYGLHQMNFTAETVKDAFGPKGDMAPLVKHMMAYTGLAAAGGVLSGTSFGDKAGHPGMDLLEGGINLNTIGGPPADAILDVLNGNMKQAANTAFKPTILARAEKAHASEGIFEGALNLSGFSR
jgi:hypothetical protein